GSMYNTTLITGAQELWKRGYTGKGVGVALIDSGVVPVDGLTVSGKVVNGPDLSFESQSPSQRYLDSYGHGTHLAGIIAGRANADRGRRGGRERGLRPARLDDGAGGRPVHPGRRIVRDERHDRSGRRHGVVVLELEQLGRERKLPARRPRGARRAHRQPSRPG